MSLDSPPPDPAAQRLLLGLQAKLELKEREVRELRRRAEELEQELERLQRAYERSLSWRVTRPLRWAGLAALQARARLAPPAPASRRAPAPTDDPSYVRWAAEHATLTPEQRARHAPRARALEGPTISVLLPTYAPDLRLLARAVASVRGQLYPRWELCIADDASPDPAVRERLRAWAAEEPRIRLALRDENGHIAAATNSALALATGELVAFLDHDDELAPHALYCVAEEAVRHPGVGLIYSDEDKLDDAGRRHSPHFKPDWNPDLLRSYNYICHLVAARRDLVTELGGLRVGFEGAQDHDLLLRLTERLHPHQIRHIPLVLYHWRATSGSTAADPAAKSYARDAAARALTEHLARTGAVAAVEPLASPIVALRVRWAVPAPRPLASLVVLTRDRLDLLRTCVTTVRQRTDYDPYELLIVDNGSVEPETLAYLAELEASGAARVLRDPRPFNFSALNNRAVEEARGEVLVLLNNDTEVTDAGWLTELVSHALRPGVGGVGARLWYPDGTIQHAGVIVGILGVAGHAHVHTPRGGATYMARAEVVQDLTAVTAACLALRRDVYREVGGMNEELPVAFNDIDLCLRIVRAGYRIVYTPFAELVHHESASRGLDDTPERAARFAAESLRMRRIWREWLLYDPAYSPNLSLERLDFALARPPRVSLESLYPAGVGGP